MGLHLISQVDTWYVPLMGPAWKGYTDGKPSASLAGVFDASSEKPAVAITPGPGCG